MDVNQLVEQLNQWYDAEAPRPPQGLDVPHMFSYLHYKAFGFSKLGPDAYRQNDAFGQPPEHLGPAALDQLARGCVQILDFRGLAQDRPLEGLTVGGFYALLRMFHFRAASRRSLTGDSPDHILDEMEMVHVVHGRSVTLYNNVLVGEAARANRKGACPHCGGSLRTRFAKQCRHCGADWHNPDRVIYRR